MKRIDFNKPKPYNHKGRWTKKYPSIFSIGGMVTFPQLMVEAIIWWRTKFIKDYKDIKKGENWYLPISKQVRGLNQQAYSICNWFPHPDDDPLVEAAIRNHIKKSKVMKFGQLRKHGNITQDEKDFVNGVWAELKKLKDNAERLTEDVVSVPETSSVITYRTNISSGKGALSKLLDLEKNG